MTEYVIFREDFPRATWTVFEDAVVAESPEKALRHVLSVRTDPPGTFSVVPKDAYVDWVEASGALLRVRATVEPVEALASR